MEWEATDMTAKYSEDYKARTGRVSWNGVSEGTKFVEITLALSGMTYDHCSTEHHSGHSLTHLGDEFTCPGSCHVTMHIVKHLV